MASSGRQGFTILTAGTEAGVVANPFVTVAGVLAPTTLLDENATVVVASGNAVFTTAPTNVGALIVLITLSALVGTAATITFAIDLEDLHGNFVQVAAGTALSAVGSQEITVPTVITTGGRLRWTTGGTVFTSATFTASVLGR